MLIKYNHVMTCKLATQCLFLTVLRINKIVCNRCEDEYFKKTRQNFEFVKL
jgi:hypothetical protein